MKRLAFSDDMMRALAAGEKTMTRRVEKRAVPAESFRAIDGPALVEKTTGEVFASVDPGWLRPRFKVGELAAAACAFSQCANYDCGGCVIEPAIYRYRMTDEGLALRYKPARVMPAALAPFVLRIVEVRAERLGEISDKDAVAEGMLHWFAPCASEVAHYASLFSVYWDRLYGDGAFELGRNSWVWVCRFEIAERRV